MSGNPTIRESSRGCSNRNAECRHFYLSGAIESELLNELLHFFPGGTRRFSSSNQFSTTLICVGAASLASAVLNIKKR